MKRKVTVFLLVVLCILQANLMAQIALPTLNTPYQQNFDGLASSGTTNPAETFPQGWTFVETGTSANTTYAAGTGASNAGNTYSFGATAADRAAGSLLSGSVTSTLGAGFTNNTDGTITDLLISYRGEQWRLGATGRADRMDFQYSVDASSLSDGSWTDVDALDFSSPVTTGTTGALDGNASLNSTTLTFKIAGLNLAPGATFYIRWLDFNAAGADDGLAIDDFVLTPGGIAAGTPIIALAPSQLNFGDVNVGTSETQTYVVTGSNLTGPIAVSSSNVFYTLSTDGNAFTSSVSLANTGDTVYVKFAPTAGGLSPGAILHQSGNASKNLTVTGNGFDQVASIIPIASARAHALGDQVTIAGRVTVANELGNPAYVQDASGGIPVFDFNFSHGVTIGDSVIVTGPMGVFNDQKQISGSGIFFTKVNATPRILTPQTFALTDLAAHEGELVKVTHVTLVNSDFVFYPQSTETLQSDGAQVDLRIDGDTDIPGLEKPDGDFEVTAVVGRFRTSIQLLPRFSADIPGLLEPTPTTDSIAPSKTFDVVDWNLEFFGARKEDYSNQEFGPEDEALQLQNVKTVMQSLKADIIAVQEVSNDTLFKELVSQLGRSYICSERYSYSFDGPSNTFPPQKVCFIYDTATVKVISSRVLFVSRYDSARLIDPSLLPNYPSGDPSSFYSSGRLPFALTINATINGATEKITLIDIHAKSGATPDDRNRRLYDATVLKDSLDAHHTGEKFIILGDLNDDLDQSIVVGEATPYAAIVSDTARYVAVTKALSDAGARSTVSFQDVIDHQILSKPLKDDYLKASAQVIVPFRQIPGYATTTSDHLPVKTRYLFKLPEVNFVQQSISASEKTAATYTVSLTLSEPLQAPQTITLAVGGTAVYGKDFTTQPAASQGKLTVQVPAHTLQTTFIVTVINDREDELDETAVFTLLNAGGVERGSRGVFTLTVQDDDIPVISFVELVQSAREGSGDQQVFLKLSTAPVTDQKVTLFVPDALGAQYTLDYVTNPQVVQNKMVIAVPAGSQRVSFAITPLADNKREVLEAVPFYISEVTPGLQSGPPQLSIFTILDAHRQIQFQVYPNPSSGPLALRSDDVGDGEVMQAELRSPRADVVYKGSGTLSDLNQAMATRMQNGLRGVYILTLRIDDEAYQVRILRN
ncbi:Endonuclease/Exonuclease/phosphatase family protein [Chryseolinea serpens]|uniref:Endonuclease/Exonuclease/phosphatase family protein n=1 Tax=Chryseolinea serpens TaxID=947013 RepID=A0A1M5RJN1_9BACT|nr:DUF5689 domain-containing protein [Chryseolinea serpens]SHH25993.1 Endonuclease/Exonuclease/phosphatase family protein [Chryseolinea serpens]